MEQREDLKQARFKRPIDQLDNDSEDDNDGTNVVASQTYVASGGLSQLHVSFEMHSISSYSMCNDWTEE